jgi:multimeric flavodoxin WrbA
MQLLCFNGSPRGKGGNTEILLGWFSEGFAEAGGVKPEIHYLRRTGEQDALLAAFHAADTVIIAFPLYTDSMPALVLRFFETLCAAEPDVKGKKLGFIVQSGFFEGIHTAALEPYLNKLSTRLGTDYLGCIRMGNGESIKHRPEKANRKIRSAYRLLGSHLYTKGGFHEETVERLKKPHTIPGPAVVVLRVMKTLGFFNGFWDKQLKAAGAYQARFDRPYLHTQGSNE